MLPQSSRPSASSPLPVAAAETRTDCQSEVEVSWPETRCQTGQLTAQVPLGKAGGQARRLHRQTEDVQAEHVLRVHTAQLGQLGQVHSDRHLQQVFVDVSSQLGDTLIPDFSLRKSCSRSLSPLPRESEIHVPHSTAG